MLAVYLQALMWNEQLTRKYYHDYALLRQETSSHAFLSLLEKLSVVKFALPLNDTTLALANQERAAFSATSSNLPVSVSFSVPDTSAQPSQRSLPPSASFSLITHSPHHPTSFSSSTTTLSNQAHSSPVCQEATEFDASVSNELRRFSFAENEPIDKKSPTVKDITADTADSSAKRNTEHTTTTITSSRSDVEEMTPNPTSTLQSTLQETHETRPIQYEAQQSVDRKDTGKSQRLPTRVKRKRRVVQIGVLDLSQVCSQSQPKDNSALRHSPPQSWTASSSFSPTAIPSTSIISSSPTCDVSTSFPLTPVTLTTAVSSVDNNNESQVSVSSQARDAPTSFPSSLASFFSLHNSSVETSPEVTSDSGIHNPVISSDIQQSANASETTLVSSLEPISKFSAESSSFIALSPHNLCNVSPSLPASSLSSLSLPLHSSLCPLSLQLSSLEYTTLLNLTSTAPLSSPPLATSNSLSHTTTTRLYILNCVVIENYNSKVPRLFLQRYNQVSDMPHRVVVEDDERELILRRLEDDEFVAASDQRHKPRWYARWRDAAASHFLSSPLFRVDVPTKRPLLSRRVLCANCQTSLSLGFFASLRYCHYTGDYYCTQCHHGKRSVIPARIITYWDFHEYEVCDGAAEFIHHYLTCPAIDLLAHRPTLYNSVPILKKIRNLRRQLVCVAQFIRTCRNCVGQFASLQAQNKLHLLDTVHLYSVQDLIDAYTGNLSDFLEKILASFLGHVTQSCSICRGKGFYCEACGSDELLFSFQFDKISMCKNCKAIYHRRCFQKIKISQCVKCRRIQRIKSRSIISSLNLASESKGSLPFSENRKETQKTEAKEDNK